MKTETWTIRLPLFIKEYFQKNGISPRKILEGKYHELKKNELPELLKELARRKEGVLQIEQSVTQIRADCNTKDMFCNTLLAKFKSQNRDINNIDHKDRFWISAQLEKQGKELGLDVDGFLEYAKRQSGSDK